MNLHNPRIIISGGGTGGHVFPAISIADALRKKIPGSEILFVGALGKLEMTKVPDAGYEIIGLPVQGFPRKVSFKIFIILFKLLKSLWLAKKIVRNFKPDLAIGVGGYASGPLLKAASRRDVPTLLQEQNSYAGITNRLLAKRASVICTAYDRMDKFFPADKIVLTGNPVRKGIVESRENKMESKIHFGLNKELPVILVIGGSLGARTLNHSIIQNLNYLKDQPVQILWQSGQYYFKESQEALTNSGATNIKLVEFIAEMNKAYAAADIIISRAGAGTISELCIIGKPVILVPSPNVAEDHQTINALSLSEKNAAVFIPDKDAVKILMSEAIKLLYEDEKLGELKENIRSLAIDNSAELIAEEAIKILKRKQ